MASNDEVHRVVCYNTVLVDQNSFAFKETHCTTYPPIIWINLWQRSCVQVQLERLCEILSRSSPAKDIPRLCALWKRGKSFCCIVVVAQFIIYCPHFTCGKETNLRPDLLAFLFFILNQFQPIMMPLIISTLTHQRRTTLHILLSFVNTSSSIISKPKQFQNNRWAI